MKKNQYISDLIKVLKEDVDQIKNFIKKTFQNKKISVMTRINDYIFVTLSSIWKGWRMSWWW